MSSDTDMSDGLLIPGRDSENQPHRWKRSSNGQRDLELLKPGETQSASTPIHQMQLLPPCPAIYFYPLNGTFVSKQIALDGGVRVPIGRRTNATTVPSERNGYFDTVSVSRLHAEIWEDGGKIFIKDVKSANGTFINGSRLSPESVESEPCELKSDDIVEFGIDVFGQDNKTILFQKVATRVSVALTPDDAWAAASEYYSYPRSDRATGSTSETSTSTRNSPVIKGISATSDYSSDEVRYCPPTPPMYPVGIGSSTAASTVAVIGMQTPTEDVVSCLVAHGCQDLTRTIDLATFGNYPVSEGGFGDIYRGRMLDGTQVAVKTLKIFVGATNQNPKALKHAAMELHTWSKCKHPNVLELLGLVVFRDRIGMVAPWMGDGNVPKYLEKVPGVNRCRLCAQICDGLSYLHDIGVVHGDLKGTNVLISSDGAPLLTDFGNSILAERTLQFTQTTERSSMTMRWSAPELLMGLGTYSKAADVYALGMTLLETMTGLPPYHGKLERSIIYTVVVNRELPGRPEEHIPTNSKDGNNLWDLLVTCWYFDPEERPSAAAVGQTMGAITQDGLTPVKSS